MMRRGFLGGLLGFPAMTFGASEQTMPSSTTKVLIKSAWGSADPTQAAFAFHHAVAFADAGHSVQIFLLGEDKVLTE